MEIKYKDFEIDVQDGDVILFRNEFILNEPITILSRIIRSITNCYYNHCGVVVFKENGVYLNEALGRGIESRKLQEVLNRTKTRIVILRKVKNFDPVQVNKLAQSCENLKYDYRALITQLLYRWLGIYVGTKNEKAIKDGMVCSEYVAYCHGMYEWWLYSSGELLIHPHFEPTFHEVQLLRQVN